MLSAIPIGLLCGLLLGGRFKVFATVPVAFGAAMLIGGFAMAGALSPGFALLDFLAFSLCLQAGYVVMLVAGPRPARGETVSPFQA